MCLFCFVSRYKRPRGSGTTEACVPTGFHALCPLPSKEHLHWAEGSRATTHWEGFLKADPAGADYGVAVLSVHTGAPQRSSYQEEEF